MQQDIGLCRVDKPSRPMPAVAGPPDLQIKSRYGLNACGDGSRRASVTEAMTSLITVWLWFESSRRHAPK
jgi:hypothetical protein